MGYTDRRKKKVDYLEVSDIEESDGDGDDEEKEDKKIKNKDASIQKKNLNKESRISSTSEEDSDKDDNLQKKKNAEKKPQKKEVAVEKKRKTTSQQKSIAVQIFKGKRKEESSEDEEREGSPTKEKNSERKESLAKEARKRKSETLPASEESPLSKSTKKKVLPLAKATAREKMVTSDSEPEIVKKDMIKIEDDSEEKTASLAEHDILSNQIREKLLCNKSLKNSIILQYHMLHCTATPGQKSEKKTISSSSGGLCVEKKIIDSKRSTASPVDMILKKLTEKVQSSPSPSSAISSPVSSPGSSYKFFKSKGGDEKVDDLAKKSVEEEDEASKKMKDHIKSC